jgi:hypothetical protein
MVSVGHLSSDGVVVPRELLAAFVDAIAWMRDDAGSYRAPRYVSGSNAVCKDAVCSRHCYDA